MKVELPNLHPFDEDMPTFHKIQPLKQIYNGWFSTARLSNQYYLLTFFNTKTKIFQSIALPVLILEKHIFELNVSFDFCLNLFGSFLDQ